MLLYTKKNLDVLYQLGKSYPNDFELGKQVRNAFRENIYILSIPNDGDLGKEIRKVIKNYKNNFVQ